MMVEMLVLEYRPLLRAQSSEKRVWMHGAGGRSTADESIEQREESSPFRFNVTLIENGKFLDGWRIAADWLVVAKGYRLQRPPYDPSG
jgi:hypothetical protein